MAQINDRIKVTSNAFSGHTMHLGAIGTIVNIYGTLYQCKFNSASDFQSGHGHSCGGLVANDMGQNIDRRDCIVLTERNDEND